MEKQPECFTKICVKLNDVAAVVVPRHVILCGQDKRELGALVFPDEEVLQQMMTTAVADDKGSSSSSSSSSALNDHDLELLLLKEVTKHNGSRPDYHHEDHIAHIKVGGWVQCRGLVWQRR